MSEMITNLTEAELDAVGAAGYFVQNSYFSIHASQSNYNSQSAYSYYGVNQQNSQNNQIIVGNGSGNGVGNVSG